MKYYFFENKILTYSRDISDSLKTSSNFTDRFTYHVPLTNAQIAFYENNPNVSINEVYATTLNKINIIPTLSITQQRINAFKYDKIIEYKGSKLSVDDAAAISYSYFVEDKIVEVAELKVLITNAKNEIRNRII